MKHDFNYAGVQLEFVDDIDVQLQLHVPVLYSVRNSTIVLHNAEFAMPNVKCIRCMHVISSSELSSFHCRQKKM